MELVGQYVETETGLPFVNVLQKNVARNCSNLENVCINLRRVFTFVCKRMNRNLLGSFNMVLVFRKLQFLFYVICYRLKET